MKKRCNIFIGGGLCYYIIEVAFRRIIGSNPTHWMMFVVGGLSLLAIVTVDDKIRCPIVLKALISGGIITMIEFVIGYIYTYILNDPIWRYGTADFMGIISLTWSMLWCGLALFILICRRLIAKFTIQND